MYCFYHTEQRGDSITELREQLDRIKSSMLFVAQTVCSSVMFDYAWLCSSVVVTFFIVRFMHLFSDEQRDVQSLTKVFLSPCKLSCIV